VAVFTVEMILKILGLGIQEYCKSFQNIFEGILVALSLIEFGL